MLLTNEPDSSFGDQLVTLLDDARHVRIATGYIGLTIFQKVERRLRAIVADGGSVKIIIGLGYFEGLSQLMIDALRDFDDYCHKHSCESGVMACTGNRFHGKLYFVEDHVGNRVASIGSSNFSSTGFGDWWEGNFIARDESTLEEVSSYINRLESLNANPIELVVFPVRGRKRAPSSNVQHGDAKDFETYEGAMPTVTAEPAFIIPITVTKASNLNLFLSSGRKNKAGIFKPRPWYEVEMTVSKEHVSEGLLSYLPHQIDPWSFKLVTRDRRCYKAKFKRKSSNRQDRRTLHEVSLDFMTNPREDLGRIIKGELEKMGLLKFGEPITSEILSEAEMSVLRFYALEQGSFLMTL